MDSRQVGDMEFVINLLAPDNGEKFVVELSDSTLTNIEGFQAEEADLTVTIDRADLEVVMMGHKRLTTLIEEGTAKATGDVGVLDKLAVTMATFTPDFEMVPGTSRPAPAEEWNPYEAGVEPIRGE